jgi:hypothetical protein
MLTIKRKQVMGRPKKSINYVSKKVFLEQSDWEFLGREAHKLSRITGQQISMAHLIRMAVTNQFKNQNND